MLVTLPAGGERPASLALFGFPGCNAADIDAAGIDGSLLWLLVERFARDCTTGAACASGVFPRVRTMMWTSSWSQSQSQMEKVDDIEGRLSNGWEVMERRYLSKLRVRVQIAC